MKEFKLRIPSEIKLIEPTVNSLKTISEELLLDEDDQWALEISLREALANAIVHGNKEDKNKYVKVSFLWNKSKFIIIVEDEGEGFKHSDLSEGPSLKTSGRGVLIIENKIDSVKYERSEKGFKVILTKKLK